MNDTAGSGLAPTPEQIAQRAAACGINLGEIRAARLAAHAREVERNNGVLHLTSIKERDAFLERHLGESLEGAAMIPPDAVGRLVDLGSGNGYPAIPVAVARPGLSLTMIEAAIRKADFLRQAATLAGLAGADVLQRQVQRAADLPGEPIRVLTTRAVGGWQRIVPRLTGSLAADGEILLWAGEEVETCLTRSAWTRLTVRQRRALPGRDRSWVWSLVPSERRAPGRLPG